MKKKNLVSVFLLYSALALVLTGCGSKLPELSEEENELVAEYAAGIALDNSENYDSGIASAEEIEKEQKRIEREEKRAQATTQATTSQETEQPQQTTDTTAQTEVAYVDLVSFLELSNVAITFQGFEIYDSYPADTDTGNYISITSQGDTELLVCKFSVENLSDAENEINILDKKALFRIGINGGTDISALPTLLPDDMTTLKDIIGSKATIEVVTVSEVTPEESEDIQSLVLNMKYNGNTGSVKLK